MYDGIVLGVERWEAMLDRVLAVAALLGRDERESLGRMGLTESRAHVVWELQRRGPCTQRALADALRVTPRAITTVIDALVETGFVTREPHPSDRRATLVTFTPRGRDAAQKLVEDHRGLARELFEGLPADAVDGFDAGLVHLVDRIRILATSTGYSPQAA